jgi:hypothetical protein
MKKLIYLCFLIATNQLYTAERTKPQEEQTELAAFIKENPQLSKPAAVELFFLKKAFKEFDQIRAQDPEQSQKIVPSATRDARIQNGRDHGAYVFYCTECGRAVRFDQRCKADEHIKEKHRKKPKQEKN